MFNKSDVKGYKKSAGKNNNEDILVHGALNLSADFFIEKEKHRVETTFPFDPERYALS